MTGYVYALWDKDETDIFYIGSSINPEQRLRQHNEETTSYDCSTPEIRYKTKDRTNYGYSIIEEVYFEETKELRRSEIYWIHQFKAWGFVLKNKQYYRKYDFNLDFININLPNDLYLYILQSRHELSVKKDKYLSLQDVVYRMILEHSDFKKD